MSLSGPLPQNAATVPPSQLCLSAPADLRLPLTPGVRGSRRYPPLSYLSPLLSSCGSSAPAVPPGSRRRRLFSAPGVTQIAAAHGGRPRETAPVAAVRLPQRTTIKRRATRPAARRACLEPTRRHGYMTGSRTEGPLSQTPTTAAAAREYTTWRRTEEGGESARLPRMPPTDRHGGQPSFDEMLQRCR